MKTAIFLGAGASAAEGAPMQGDLFNEYFKAVHGVLSLPNSPQNSTPYIKRELGNFFRDMFTLNTDADLKTLAKMRFPTFEEALGILDLAELRRESLKKFQSDGLGPDSNRIRLVRQFLVLAMADVIARKLREPAGNKPHRTLTNNLRDKNLLQDTIFLSTNYDILIDNALTQTLGGPPGLKLDYGLEFSKAINESTDWAPKPGPDAVKLFKLHGSLNWLYCATCNGIAITQGKGVIKLITNPNDARCNVCQTVLAPIIVPPTFYKDMSKVFLSMVWNQAETSLQGLQHLIFCGYSFPDADIHVKYLIKRIQTNRKEADRRIRFTVISHHPGKTDKQAEEEKGRYLRFLGTDVKFTAHTFEDFVRFPSKFYNGRNLTLI